MPDDPHRVGLVPFYPDFFGYSLLIVLAYLLFVILLLCSGCCPLLLFVLLLTISSYLLKTHNDATVFQDSKLRQFVTTPHFSMAIALPTFDSFITLSHLFLVFYCRFMVGVGNSTVFVLLNL